jgi:hypothetical protein
MERSYALIFARFAVCIIVLAVPGVGRADGQEQDNRIARKFFELREQTLDQRGTTVQVEQVLALFKKNGATNTQQPPWS